MNYQKVFCESCHKSLWIPDVTPPPWAQTKRRKHYCPSCSYKRNRFWKRINALNLDTPALIQSAKDCCSMSMINTGVGAWLAAVIDRLEREHQTRQEQSNESDNN